MKSRLSIIAGLLAGCLLTQAWADLPGAVSSELTQAVQAYQAERWTTALGHFLHVLTEDPSNKEAHTYVNLIVRKLEAQQARRSHDDRFTILTASSRLLDDHRKDSSVVDEALRQTTAAEANRQKQGWHSQCNIAQIEAQLGHLAAADDLVLQVIAQDPNDREAQQLLSNLQSQIREALDTRKAWDPVDRHTLEGFYAYAQADYAPAAAAWGQARSALDPGLPLPEIARQVALLHFESYDKIARQHLDDERQAHRARDLFAEGLAAFDAHDFDRSLEDFRQVALINPEFSQLGAYLVQSEAAVERKRMSEFSESKRQEVTHAFAKALRSLEKGTYAEAEASFKEVLALDPTHPQARQYLQQIDTQKNRQVDPTAAQQHYEAGVIAYVGGDSEQAVREWHIAQRLDPDNPKITEAVHKVERELVLSKELP